MISRQSNPARLWSYAALYSRKLGSLPNGASKHRWKAWTRLPAAIVYSQLRLVEKYRVEPAAAQILGNLIDHLVKPRATPKKTALIGPTPAYAAYLRGLGLRFDALSGELDAARLAPYGLVVCRGGVAHAAPLLVLPDSRLVRVLLPHSPARRIDPRTIEILGQDRAGRPRSAVRSAFVRSSPKTHRSRSGAGRDSSCGATRTIPKPPI